MRKRARNFAATAAIGGLAVLAAGLVLAPASSAGNRASVTNEVSCGATALELLGINLSDLLGNPCRPASDGVEIPLPAGNHIYVLRGVLNGTTVPAGTGGGGSSSASLLDLKLLTTLLPVQVLKSSVYVTCRAGKPVVSGGSTTLGGADLPLAVPVQLDHPLQLGSLVFINERVASKTGLTTRALRVATPAGDVILSQASGSYSGNPCKRVRRR